MDVAVGVVEVAEVCRGCDGRSRGARGASTQETQVGRQQLTIDDGRTIDRYVLEKL